MLWNIYNELKEDVHNKIHNDVTEWLVAAAR